MSGIPKLKALAGPFNALKKVLDTELGSTPEGTLVKAVLRQTVEDIVWRPTSAWGYNALNDYENFLSAKECFEGKGWVVLCKMIQADPDEARQSVMPWVRDKISSTLPNLDA